MDCPTITVIKMRTVQRSELALKLKPMLAAQAKERQRESQKNFHGNQHTSGMGQISAPHQKSKTSDDIAKIAGVSNNLSVWSKFPLPFRL